MKMKLIGNGNSIIFLLVVLFMNWTLKIYSQDTLFLEDGTIVSIGNYEHGIKVGEWKGFYPNGKIHWQVIFDEHGNKNGMQITYYSNSCNNIKEISNYEHGKKEGEYAYFRENGIIAFKYSYKNGIKEGIQRVYNGVGICIKQYFLVGGKIQGEYIEWFDNGVVKVRGAFNESQPIGYWRIYYDSGNLQKYGKFSKMILKIDYIDGEYEFYEIEDQRLIREGEWIFYKMNGDELKRIKYP